MPISVEHQHVLRKKADGPLYDEALRFLDEYRPPDAAQLNGLLAFAGRYTDLKRFVEHQSGRNWEGNKKHYNDFYSHLGSSLLRLQKQADEFLPSNLTNRERAVAREEVATYLAGAFTQHLTAEALLRLAR